MRAWVRTETTRLIEGYGLHDEERVRLRVLEDSFPYGYHDLSAIGALGMILPPPAGWPADPANRARVALDHTLGPWQDRLVYAHEVGHGVCRHLGTAALLTLDLHDRAEREAWEVAAHLLIPDHVIREYRTREVIAAVCYVPPWLVDLRAGSGAGPRGRARDAPECNTEWGLGGESLFCASLWGFWGPGDGSGASDRLPSQHIDACAG